MLLCVFIGVKGLKAWRIEKPEDLKRGREERERVFSRDEGDGEEVTLKERFA